MFMALSLVNMNAIVKAEDSEHTDIVLEKIEMNKKDFVPGDVVSYTFTISEEVKNVYYIEISFYQPMNGAIKYFEQDYSEEDLNWLNGVYTLDITTDNTFQNGEWKLHMISFYDLDGNYLSCENNPDSTSESTEELIFSDLSAYNFNFSGATDIDLENPTLVDVSMNKHNVLVGEEFNVYVTAKDNVAVNYVWVEFIAPSGEYTYMSSSASLENLPEETIEINCYIDENDYQAGTWRMSNVILEDVAGNYVEIGPNSPEYEDCYFELTKKDPTRIEFVRPSIKMEVGNEAVVNARVYVDDIEIYQEVTYSCDSDILYFEPWGGIRAKALGNAVVTATTKNGLTATCTVKVVENVNVAFRFAGENRYDTAFKSADFLKQLVGAPDTVIIANGENFADALAGSYLAAQYVAPILMTNHKSAVITSVLDYIEKNAQPGAKVYILGGKNAVPESIDAYLKDRSYEVERLAGKDRYETNLMILNEIPGYQRHILVCTGTGFADSLSVSALGKPILLVGKKLTAEQKEYLRRNMEAEVRIIGGTSAVSKNIEYECMNYTYVKRIAGANRYETSIKVAENYFDEIDGMVLAYARNFPDGLSAGPLAYVTGSPLILTDSSKNNKLANDYAHKMLPSFSFTIGGSKLITDETLRDMFDLLPEEEILKGFIVSE